LQDDAVLQIQSFVPLIDWNKALEVWSLFTDFPHSVTVQKPVIATATEDCKHVAEKLELAAEELNTTDIDNVPELCNVDSKPYTEQFCSDNSKDTHIMQNTLPDIEDVSLDETCATEKDVVMSRLKNETQNCTDNSDSSGLVVHDNICDTTEEVSINATEKSTLEKETFLPSFRATCYRTGNHHCFQSPLAAAQFGGAVQDYFGWNVNLSNYDIEVVLCIEDRDVRVGIALTNQSLHRRHITHFGRTTLRPTIAHGMLR